MTMIFLAIMSTQFSFGRFFRALFRLLWDGGGHALEAFGKWRDDRRKEKQRREVIAKHVKKGAPAPEIKAPARRLRWSPRPRRGAGRTAGSGGHRGRAPGRAAQAAQVTMPAPPLPLSDPEPAARHPPSGAR